MAATTTPNSQQNKKNKGIPPKRGQIKAQIFESFLESVASIFSSKDTLEEPLFKGNDDDGGGGDGSNTSSTITTTMVASISSPPTA